MSVRARCCSSWALTRPLTPEARRKLEERTAGTEWMCRSGTVSGICLVQSASPGPRFTSGGHWDGSWLVGHVQVFYRFTFDEFQKKQKQNRKKERQAVAKWRDSQYQGFLVYMQHKRTMRLLFFFVSYIMVLFVVSCIENVAFFTYSCSEYFLSFFVSKLRSYSGHDT